MQKFEQNLEQGKMGESLIAQYFRSRGHHVLPVYEVGMDTGKGPAVFSARNGAIVAPDMLVFSTAGVWWVEAKHKSAFSLHRITGRMVTGIDLRHYEEYQRIQTLVDWQVWLLFLQAGCAAKDSPPSNSGLYGRKLNDLVKNENHRSKKYGPSGMVYWHEKTLRKIAAYIKLDGKMQIVPLSVEQSMLNRS